MASIQEINVSPLNKITAQITADIEQPGATVFYQISNGVDSYVKFGSIIVDEDFYLNHGTDKKYILDFLITELGITLL